MNKELKKLQRKELSERRKAVPLSVKNEHNEQIFKSVLSFSPFEEAETVLCYFSVKDEADTTGIIRFILEKSDKCLAIPKVLENGNMDFFYIDKNSCLTTGYKGIAEPTGTEDAFAGGKAICLVPALGFDRQGNRIGYGGGYYDRYLERKEILKVGLAFSEQIVDKVICEKEDVSMDYIITDKEIIKCFC